MAQSFSEHTYTKHNAPRLEYERAIEIRDKHVAHGTFTNSKGPRAYYAQAHRYRTPYPEYVISGEKCYVKDIKGRVYIDYVCGLGTNLFGYRNPDVTRAIKHELDHRVIGCSFPSEIEYVFTYQFLQKNPWVEKIKVLKTGSEGCAAAIRIARAATNRKLILSTNYHGWHDEFTSLTDPAYGVPREHFKNIAPLSPKSMHAHQGLVAAVIMEPISLDPSPEHRTYLERIREYCDKWKTLLIFDETVTAYRVPGNSVANFWGIQPDMTIQGKALANGMPISVVGASAKIMDCDYFVSSTFAGEALTLAAATECAKLISSADFNAEELWESGKEFIAKMNPIMAPFFYFSGLPTRLVLSGGVPTSRENFLMQMARAGVLMSPKINYYNIYLHRELDNILSITKTVMQKGAQKDIY